jgi:hypothetical protein
MTGVIDVNVSLTSILDGSQGGGSKSHHVVTVTHFFKQLSNGFEITNGNADTKWI